MGNLVRAEIFRIFKKKSLWGYLALFTVLLLITALLYFLYMRGASDGVPKNSEGLRELGFSFVAVIPLFLFPFLFQAVYSDDITWSCVSRNLGCSIRKPQYVMAKLIVYVFCALVSVAVLFVWLVVSYSLLSFTVPYGTSGFRNVILELLLTLPLVFLNLLVPTLISATVLYASGKTVVAGTVGLLYILNIPSAFLSLITLASADKLNLSRLSWDYLHNEQYFALRDSGSSYGTSFIIAALFYIDWCLLLQIFFLHRRELE